MCRIFSSTPIDSNSRAHHLWSYIHQKIVCQRSYICRTKSNKLCWQDKTGPIRTSTVCHPSFLCRWNLVSPISYGIVVSSRRNSDRWLARSQWVVGRYLNGCSLIWVLEIFWWVNKFLNIVEWEAIKIIISMVALRSYFLISRKLSGLMSAWMMFAACRWSTIDSICVARHMTIVSSRFRLVACLYLLQTSSSEPYLEYSYTNTLALFPIRARSMAINADTWVN